MNRLPVQTIKFILLFSFLISNIYFNRISAKDIADKQSIKKVRDIVIYEDSRFYASFPSVISTDDGEIIVAFRRAPDRKLFNESGTNHVDANSYLVTMKSSDGGESWTPEPKLLYAHPFGGSQDPCLLRCSDGSLICASYGWAFVRESGLERLKQLATIHQGVVVFLGGYLLFSSDNGNEWEGPIYPPPVQGELRYSAFGEVLPAYNRGAMYEGENGKIYWVVAGCTDSTNIKKTSNHLLVSEDKGRNWKYMSVVAEDTKASFNETSIYETPKGDLVAFMRTAGMDDQACIARSVDGGKTFGQWEKMGFQGHPLQAIRLPDNRVFLVYGYRHKPYGIRARILNAECTDYATAEEIIIRDDGGSGDIGYPWAVMIDDHKILVTYYFNKNNGTRHIAGTVLELF